MNSTTLQQWAPTAHALLRIVTGLIFLEHGLQKFFGFPPGQMANIPFDNMGAYAGVIELACGFLVTIGLFTRPAAFLASGTMAVAYWTAHFPQNPFPLNNGGDAAILYCFVFLYFVFAGAGPLSVDAARTGRRG
jgi:putative oxidoreductase